MNEKKLREIIARLDAVEADQRACENRITRIRLDLVQELNGPPRAVVYDRGTHSLRYANEKPSSPQGEAAKP